MLPVHWVLGPSSRGSGSMAHGLFLNNLSPLPIRNYFLWLLQLLCGDISGARGMFCFALIMMRWSTCWTPTLRRSDVLCDCYATFCSPLPATASPFQPNMFLSSTTSLLMLSLVHRYSRFRMLASLASCGPIHCPAQLLQDLNSLSSNGVWPTSLPSALPLPLASPINFLQNQPVQNGV